MKRGQKRSFASLTSISLLFTMVACGGGSGGGSSLDNGNVSAQSVGSNLGSISVGSSTSLDFSSSSASVTFDDLSGSERFIVAFYSGSTSASSYSSSISGSEGLPLDENIIVSAHSVSSLTNADSNEEEITENFHNALREAEAKLPLKELRKTYQARSLINHSLAPDLSIGDTRSIKVLNSLSNTNDYSSRTGVLAYQTEHFNFYIDSEDQDVLSNSEIQDMADDLESHASTEFATFGSVSDVDNDGKVNIFYTHILNGLSSSGIVTGYFFGGDLYDSYSSSNMAEFIYCHVPDDSGEHGVAIPKSFFLSNTGPLCTYHELQHAINFNMKVFVNGGSPEPGAYNEGRSHLAEDLINDFQTVSNENPSRVELCLENSSALASFGNGTGLAQRGCSYLFQLYLYEQAELGRFAGISGGSDLIYRIGNTALTGMDAILEETGEDADTLLGDFFSAIYLSNTGLSNDNRYNFSAINLRASQDDNRGTVLSGPNVTTPSLPSSGSIPGLGSAYYYITGSTLISEGSTLTLSGASGMSPGARLIRLGDL